MSIAMKAPGRYVQGFGERKKLGQSVKKLGNSFYVITSPGGRRRFGDEIEQSLKEQEKAVVFGEFHGEATKAEVFAHMDACKAAGYSPFLCSAYRTQETQQQLYDNKVQRLINSGMGEEEAKVEAAKAVAIPGTSEHQLGLAVDIVDANMQDLTDEQENTATQKWLMANSWRYGFIHRYPNDKTDITGIIYEPWHYRYVGKDAAQDIFNRDITLEEYLGKAEH